MEDINETGTESVEATEVAPEGESLESELTNDEGTDQGAEQNADGDVERFVVKIDGEELEVTLDELLNGYSRHSDYTRKTQELAAQRQEIAELAQLQQWLQEDPAGTIQALAKAYGLTAVNGEEDDLEGLDPVERRLRSIEQAEQARQEAARQTAIVSEATAAITSQGLTDSTPEALLQYALDNRIGDLRVAARLLKVDLAEQAEAAKSTRKVEVVERKRKAAVVEGGRTTPAAATTPAKPKRMSLREAWDAS